MLRHVSPGSGPGCACPVILRVRRRGCFLFPVLVLWVCLALAKGKRRPVFRCRRSARARMGGFPLVEGAWALLLPFREVSPVSLPRRRGDGCCVYVTRRHLPLEPGCPFTLILFSSSRLAALFAAFLVALSQLFRFFPEVLCQGHRQSPDYRRHPERRHGHPCDEEPQVHVACAHLVQPTCC